MESTQSTKRGKYVYKSFKDLRDQYGESIAKDIRQRKYDAEKMRQPGEEPFCTSHPEVPNDEDGFFFGIFSDFALEAALLLQEHFSLDDGDCGDHGADGDNDNHDHDDDDDDDVDDDDDGDDDDYDDDDDDEDGDDVIMYFSYKAIWYL